MARKQTRNSYYFFMQELQEEYRQQGLNHNMASMAELAAPKWKEMTKEERAPYEKMAKDSKAFPSNKGRLDSYRKPISETDRANVEELRKKTEASQFVEQLIQGFANIYEVIPHTFNFVSTKSFGKKFDDDGYYVPAEIGLVKYSIAQGIIDQYHSFIYPGESPTLRSIMKETSERTHNIPPENFELANRNYTEIVDGIYNVVNLGDARDTCPVLYCHASDLKQTDFILNIWLMSRVPAFRQRQFKICDITKLFCEIYCHFGNFSDGVVENDWLSSSAFLWKQNTCCQWHSDKDIYCCALGNAKSYGYIFSNHLCDHFNVAVIPGSHLPGNSISPTSDELPPFQRIYLSATSSSKRSTGFSSNAAVCQSGESSWRPKQTDSSDFDSLSESSDLKFSTSSPKDELGYSEAFPVCLESSKSVFVPPKFTDKTFAGAVFNPSFELEKEDFPELEASTNTKSKDVNISSASSVSSVSTVSSSVRRALGRGILLKRPQ